MNSKIINKKYYVPKVTYVLPLLKITPKMQTINHAAEIAPNSLRSTKSSNIQFCPKYFCVHILQRLLLRPKTKVVPFLG
jgi:hypothetical protein